MLTTDRRYDPASASVDPAFETDDGPRLKRGETTRCCIVERTARPVDALIRFVVGPHGDVVPDIKGQLPGRGAWVSARHEAVAHAARKRLFSRAFRTQVGVPDTLAEMIAALLRRHALEGLGLTRKAGRLVTGYEKVADRIRGGRAALVLTATDAGADGVRRIAALVDSGAKAPATSRAFTADEMTLALGGGNVIHAAIEPGHETERLLARIRRYERFTDASADADKETGGVEEAPRDEPADGSAQGTDAADTT